MDRAALGTQAYIISRSGMQKLLQQVQRSDGRTLHLGPRVIADELLYTALRSYTSTVFPFTFRLGQGTDIQAMNQNSNVSLTNEAKIHDLIAKNLRHPFLRCFRCSPYYCRARRRWALEQWNKRVNRTQK